MTHACAISMLSTTLTCTCKHTHTAPFPFPYEISMKGKKCLQIKSRNRSCFLYSSFLIARDSNFWNKGKGSLHGSDCLSVREWRRAGDWEKGDKIKKKQRRKGQTLMQKTYKILSFCHFVASHRSSSWHIGNCEKFCQCMFFFFVFVCLNLQCAWSRENLWHWLHSLLHIRNKKTQTPVCSVMEGRVKQKMKEQKRERMRNQWARREKEKRWKSWQQ